MMKTNRPCPLNPPLSEAQRQKALAERDWCITSGSAAVRAFCVKSIRGYF